MDALQLLAFQQRKLSVEVVGTADFFFHIVVLIILHFLAALLNQVSNVLGHIAEFSFLDSVQRVEVIVDMLQTRFAKAGNAIHQFAGKVVALIVVQPFFEHGVIVEAAHGYRSRALHLLDKLFLELCGTHGTAQSPQVFVDKRGDGQLEVRLCVFENFAKLFAGMFAHQLQRFFAVRCLHQLFESFVALFFCFAFLIHHLAAYQDECCQSDEGND